MEANLESMPADVLREFLEKMDWKEARNYCKTNKRIAKICEQVWVDKAKKEFNADITKDKRYKDTMHNYLVAGSKFYTREANKEEQNNNMNKAIEFSEKADSMSKVLAEYLLQNFPEEFKRAERVLRNSELDEIIGSRTDQEKYRLLTQGRKLLPNNLLIVMSGLQDDNQFYSFVVFQINNTKYDIKMDQHVIAPAVPVPNGMWTTLNELGITEEEINEMYKIQELQQRLQEMPVLVPGPAPRRR
jgi:hypothetical protein